MVPTGRTPRLPAFLSPCSRVSAVGILEPHCLGQNADPRAN